MALFLLSAVMVVGVVFAVGVLPATLMSAGDGSEGEWCRRAALRQS
jgi:hypothetical protein